MNKNDFTSAGKSIQRASQAASPLKNHQDFLGARLKKISEWVKGGVKPEALMRFALMDMSKSPKLAACTPQSIYLSLLACAVAGLEPGALKGEAYLVPFGGEATFMVGWRGIVKQARRSRDIVGFAGNVVYERDLFDLDLGTENKLVHKPLTMGDRGEVIGSYAIARMVGGHNEIEFLDRAALDKIRNVAEARGRSPAWKDWPDQMMRKSAVRRLGKRLPLGEDYYYAAAIDSAHEDGKTQREVIDLLTDNAGAVSAEQLASAPTVLDVQPDDPGAEFGFDAENVQ